MKHHLILLGIAAAALAVVPSVRAGAPNPKKAALATAPKKAQPIYYYITSYTPTGSHIPLVLCRYEGHYYSSSPLAIYRTEEIGASGSLSVGGALRELDPAISSVH